MTGCCSLGQKSKIKQCCHIVTVEHLEKKELLTGIFLKNPSDNRIVNIPLEAVKPKPFFEFVQNLTQLYLVGRGTFDSYEKCECF